MDIFHTNIKSAINQGRNISQCFRIKRCGQRETIPPYNVVLCAESMANKKLEKNEYINIGENFSISLFANDISLVLCASAQPLAAT